MGLTMKLSLLMPIIAFTGLFGYGSYREAFDACDKWSASGREIQYQRPYTKSEILETAKVQNKIKSERRRLEQDLASLPIESPPPPTGCRFLSSKPCSPEIDDRLMIENQISNLEDDISEEMIEELSLIHI